MSSPRVVVHVAVSLDGRTAGFTPDHDALRRLAGTWPGARIVGAAEERAGDLLGQGLVDEVSLLVHPAIAGEGHPSWSGGARLPAGSRLVRRSAERVEPGLAWLRFDVRDGGAA
ncbi:MAG: hypothetical protein KY466_05875 [Gemmatimonadetes bacterium]|nr:hypothetical protein [Gemmatimonadota bacterium]